MRDIHAKIHSQSMYCLHVSLPVALHDCLMLGCLLLGKPAAEILFYANVGTLNRTFIPSNGTGSEYFNSFYLILLSE